MGSDIQKFIKAAMAVRAQKGNCSYPQNIKCHVCFLNCEKKKAVTFCELSDVGKTRAAEQFLKQHAPEKLTRDPKRPKADEDRRDVQFHYRLTRKEADAFNAASDAFGYRPSELAREMVTEFLKRSESNTLVKCDPCGTHYAVTPASGYCKTCGRLLNQEKTK